MRPYHAAAAALLAVTLFATPAAAQVGASARNELPAKSGMSSMMGFDTPELAGTPIGGAFARWLENFDDSRLGQHFALNPQDSASGSGAWLAVAQGDFSGTDDAALLNLFELFDETLAVAPVDVCSQFLSSGGESFFDLLATVDSTRADQWVDAIETLILGTLDPGTRTPAADPVQLQTAVLRAMLELPEEERALWMQLVTDPASMSEEESCDATRVLFGTFNRIPESERVAVIRASMGAGK